MPNAILNISHGHAVRDADLHVGLSSELDSDANAHQSWRDGVSHFLDIDLNKLSTHAPRLSQWKDIFWDSICTEYDARRLYWHIARTSPEVFRSHQSILTSWLKDEIEHALGFQMLYSRLYRDDLAAVGLQLEMRDASFEHVDHLLKDGLSLLLLLAYDEIVTTHVYHRSIADYDAFGVDALSTWIRKLKNDETRHLLSFIQEAKRAYPGRLEEGASILEDIVEADFSSDGYRGTFVLDHHAPEFPLSRAEIEMLLIPAVLRRLRE